MGLTLEGVSVALPGQVLVAAFDLSVGRGEIVTVMGPSGSGKSSLLAFIAGDLEPPLSGQGHVRLDDTLLDGRPPEKRSIGRLFQDDLLFPHLTVAENLLFGMPRGHAAERHRAVETALAEAGLAGLGARPPHTLSGGQRARVALMRALLARPRAMLLDEPFGKLDAELRAAMRAFVFGHLRERAIPAIMVTHDRGDAPPGGRILVLGTDGRIRDA